MGPCLTWRNGIGVASARLIRFKPTYIFKSYSSIGLSLPIFFKSYSSLGLTIKPTFNNGFDLLDNGLALITHTDTLAVAC